MANIFKHAIVSIVIALLAGWVAFVAIHAGLIFLVPHGPHFAPEVGPSGAFLIFGAVYTGFYLADFALIAVPLYFIHFRRPIRPWQAALWGAALFALSVPVWCVICRHLYFQDMLSGSAIAVIPGSVSFYVLARLKPPNVSDEKPA